MRSMLIALVGLTGCNQLFGIEQTILIDAAIIADASPDRDDDGVENDVDNCPDVTNPEQYDEDGDGAGDACDPCPLDPGPMLDADQDGIGDACDPHPTDAIDCLRLFDSFRGYSNADWLSVPGSLVEPGDGEVRLRIQAGSRTGIGPAEITGPSAFRVRFAAVTIGTELRLLDRSAHNNTDDGHYCSVTRNTVTLGNVVFGEPPITSFTPDLVAGAPMTATIVHDLAPMPPQFSCLPSPGLNVPMTATIYVSVNGSRPMIVGVGAGTDLTLAAVAFYGPRADTACAAPVIR